MILHLNEMAARGVEGGVTRRLFFSALLAASLLLTPAVSGLARADEPSPVPGKKLADKERYSDKKDKINAEVAALLPRGVSDDWKKRGMDATRDLVKILAKAGIRLYPLFRPAVASPEFIKLLRLKPGDKIVDLGGGTGALAIGMLEQGVKFKHLYVVDTCRASIEFLTFMLETTAYPGKERVTPIRCTNTDPMIPVKDLTRILIINVPGFNATAEKDGKGQEVKPEVLKVFKALASHLRPGGVMQIIYEVGHMPIDKRVARKVMEVDARKFSRYLIPLKMIGLEHVSNEEWEVWGVLHDVVTARKPR